MSTDHRAGQIGPVLVVGCGLIGASVGLALRRRDVVVHLRDLHVSHAEMAESLGAGTTSPPAEVGLVVVAVPPAHVASAVQEALAAWPDAVVTDVSSVKSAVLATVETLRAADKRRYVGGHPMAGSERSGPMAASGSLFEGRAWAVTPHGAAAEDAVAVVRDLATACGAEVIVLDAEEHDLAVARVSHLPHVMSALAAAQLNGAPPEHMALAGQGLRDVTRIASSDPALWRQILGANGEPVAALLRGVRADIDRLLDGLGDQLDEVDDILGRGVTGTALIPGKHGLAVRLEVTVFVQVPDRPGELARLFHDTGDIGVNIEDLRIDHDLGRPVGVAEIGVLPDRADTLVAELSSRGWTAYR